MANLSISIFEELLTALCNTLTKESEKSPFEKSKVFENRVREVLKTLTKGLNLDIDFNPHPYLFPDIVLRNFGIEVKFTTNDTWRSIANSVFESTRAKGLDHIYIVYGKMGGAPSVAWGKYDDCVIHVRTSHVPRFEVDMSATDSLFNKIRVPYSKFCHLPFEERMAIIRKYARARLRKGERLWWLEDNPEAAHSLPLEVRLYMRLPQNEKRRLRAEAALLCPKIVEPSRSRGKYIDAALYLLTYHGVLCPQARDLFSAGSVALRSSSLRGGNYLLRALQDIQEEMKEAASNLEDALFIEYWGVSVLPKNRIREWLKRADRYAIGWKPSEHLFKG